MFDCILLLAGLGSRSGLNYNKIKYQINGKPLYQYSLDVFENIDECNSIILVVNEVEYDEFKRIASDEFKRNHTKEIKVCVGGRQRQDSVYEGLKLAKSDYVLIHDGARPNITKEEVLAVYNEALKNDASALAVREKNAIKVVNDFYANKTLDRSNIWIMQTPQGVKRELLINALSKIKHLIYDDIQAVEEIYGIKAKIVEGRYENIKVTTPDDLKYIEYLLVGDKKNV